MKYCKVPSTGDQTYHASIFLHVVRPIAKLQPPSGNHQDLSSCQRFISSSLDIFESYQEVAPFVVVVEPADASFSKLGGFQHSLHVTISLLESLRS